MTSVTFIHETGLKAANICFPSHKFSLLNYNKLNELLNTTPHGLISQIIDCALLNMNSEGDYFNPLSKGQRCTL